MAVGFSPYLDEIMELLDILKVSGEQAPYMSRLERILNQLLEGKKPSTADLKMEELKSLLSYITMRK